MLWVSPLARFEPGVAVRGGIPLVFPWFGSGPDGDRQPAHGFARTAAWQRTALVDEVATNGRLEVRYTLDSDGFDSKPFRAELRVRFAHDQLRAELSVTNTGKDTFTYEEALHTYLAVSDIARVAILGLEGCHYQDSVPGAEQPDQVQAGPVRIKGETDRLYDHTGELLLDDPDWSRQIRVAKDGSATTVVWNPGAAKGAGLADVGQNWAGFVCIEAANVRETAISLAPGETHLLAQQLHLT